MFGQVQTENGQKKVVPLSNVSTIDNVIDGDMHAVTSNAVYDRTKYIKQFYYIDARGLSTSYFYPVTFGGQDTQIDCEVHSPNVGEADPYNQNLIHFLLMAQGWSDTPKRIDVLQYGVYDASEITIGCVGGGIHSGCKCVWVRGGLLYRFISNTVPTLRTSNYTYGDEVFTVGTGYSGGSNTNVETYWSPNASYGTYFGASVNVQNYLYINGNPIWVS